MRWFSRLRLRVRSLVRRKHLEQELRDELQFHLGNLMEEKYVQGMTRLDTPPCASWAGLSRSRRSAGICEK
jgi:hypothetical protein